LDRAKLTGVKPTYCLGYDFYKVTSPRAGDTYIITPTGTGYTCTCAAGQIDQNCWHAALVATLPYECSRRAAHKTARLVAKADPLLEGFNG
jgi:hypothetical protein